MQAHIDVLEKLLLTQRVNVIKIAPDVTCFILIRNDILRQANISPSQYNSWFMFMYKKNKYSIYSCP